MNIDAAQVIARLQVPVLIVNGTTNVQVSVELDARPLAAAAPGARLVVIDGMNHVLNRVSGPTPQQLPSYSDPSLPVVPELIDAIVEFIRKE